jgi:branched-chain amino acid aminotransferase
MRVPDKAFPAAAKSISQYAGARIAQIQAREAGYDGCILRASDGSLSDAPTAALFLIIDGGLHTAPLSSDVLPSITRAWVLATAVTARIPTHIHPISKDDVYQSDEAFLCGTAVELSSVRRIDNAAMRSWPARPITSRLLVAFAEQTRGRTGVPDFPLQLR